MPAAAIPFSASKNFPEISIMRLPQCIHQTCVTSRCRGSLAFG
jgi:hypothetical protein